MQKCKASSTKKKYSFGTEREQASETSEELSSHKLQLHFPSSTTKRHKGSLDKQIFHLPLEEEEFSRGAGGDAENKIQIQRGRTE